MYAAWILVTSLTMLANLYAAMLDITRDPRITDSMARTRVPESRLPVLGLLKTTGAGGLLLGLGGVPWIGTIAAAGLVAFFIGAIATHLRARDVSLGYPLAYLALAIMTLALDLAR